MIELSAREIAPLAEMTNEDGRKVRVTARGEYGDAVPDRPEH